MRRVPAPGGVRGPDGKPALVLADGSVLQERYRSEFFAMGGMSAVYRVYSLVDSEQNWLAKEVAASDAKALLALGQEKSLLERLDHPSIVKVHDLFEEEGYYYLVRDFVQGRTLEEELPSEGFLEERVVLDWGLRLCAILNYLHSQNPPVIYRDLKPRNILKDADGKLLLFDFGIARSYKEGRAQNTLNLGSTLTASPEHYGGQTDARSDIYTLAATLHYLLSNGQGERQSPFHFPALTSVNPRVSAGMDAVIRKCLQHKPELRYQTVGEVAEALLALHAPAAAEPPADRRRLLPLLGLLPLLAALGWLLRPHPPARPTPAVAVRASGTPEVARPMPVLAPPTLAASPTASPTVAPTVALVAPLPRPSPVRSVVPSVVVVHPSLNVPDYPQAHPTAHPPTPVATASTAPALRLPEVLDSQYFTAPRRLVSGPRDATGVEVRASGLHFHLPRGYDEAAEQIWVTGEKRTLRMLAVQSLSQSAAPQDYADLRQQDLQAEAAADTHEQFVGGRPAVRITFRRPSGRRVIVCTEIYTTSPDGAAWMIAASSTQKERVQAQQELKAIIESWVWE